jgi:arylsulfatase A-like enzyme
VALLAGVGCMMIERGGSVREAGGGGGGAGGASGAPRRPNILFITADDMSFDSLGCTGCPLPNISPNLDRLAREGLLIDHCHIATPVCGPSRAALITGTWPQRNGTMGHYNQPPQWFGHSPITSTLAELLRSHAGYYTAVICKNPTAIGWDYQASHLDTGLGRDPAKFEQITRRVIETAIQQNKPFFLHANSMDPHEFWAGQKHETRSWINAMMGGAEYETYPNGKPYPDPQVTYSKDQIPVPPCWPDNDAIRQDIYTYYNSVHRLDETVGAILRALEASGQAQSTMVVFISDHGMGREFAKWSADGKNEIPKEMSSGQTIRKILRATGHADRAKFEAYRAREEFYDTVNDPGCLVNLIDDPALARPIGQFRAELLRTMEQVNDQEMPNYRAHLSPAHAS